MKNKKLQEQLDKYYEDIKENYYLLNIVDFHQDIDIDKSEGCKYHVNDEGHLQFFYQKTSGYRLEDCRLIAENLTEEQLKEWIPQKYSAKRPNWKPSKILYDETYNIYCIERDEVNERLKDVEVFGIEAPEYFTDHQWLLCEICDSDESTHNNTVSENLNIKYLIEPKDNCTSIFRVTNGMVNIDDEISSISNDQRTMTLYDFEINKLFQWSYEQEQTTVLLEDDFQHFLKKHNLVWLLVMPNKQSEFLQNGLDEIIETIGYGHKQGEIFLYPIESDIKTFDVKIASASEVALEYSSNGEADWKPVDLTSPVQIKQVLHIKLGINSISTLFDCSMIKRKHSMNDEFCGNIKRLNFEEVIDHQNSDVYLIDKKRAYLEFLYHEVGELKEEDAYLLLGEEQMSDNGRIEYVPSFQKRDDGIYRFGKVWKIEDPMISFDGIKIAIKESFNSNVLLRVYNNLDVEKDYWESVKNNIPFSNSTNGSVFERLKTILHVRNDNNEYDQYINSKGIKSRKRKSGFIKNNICFDINRCSPRIKLNTETYFEIHAYTYSNHAGNKKSKFALLGNPAKVLKQGQIVLSQKKDNGKKEEVYTIASNLKDAENGLNQSKVKSICLFKGEEQIFKMKEHERLLCVFMGLQ
ncbi:hypothetical protein [Anoxynatronum buryatiense]|uniref:Uncharacterized protein n=1 Tax=Anoxynatronum buryatiense TaxID=489973 RepID=A0AA45WVG9_9CLOT|nr:hypothetical protein [Anoxynatronum buryatiense]SMP52529.1 hypothetical protein SAMN06296020_104253 [Anoxynatronum buryatiense]